MLKINKTGQQSDLTANLTKLSNVISLNCHESQLEVSCSQVANLLHFPNFLPNSLDPQKKPREHNGVIMKPTRDY